MDCETCKERPATLHLTNIINGKKTEIHVCQQCAKEKGYIESDEDAYSIHDLLSDLFNFKSSYSKQPAQNAHEIHQSKCNKCGMTYQEFAKVGKFGCSNCYQSFADRLNPIFQRVHSENIEHNGKIPKRQHVHLQKKRLLQDYRETLQRLIEEENFEEAAKVRDKIRAVEKKESTDDTEDGEN